MSTWNTPPNRLLLDSPLPHPAVSCGIRQLLYVSDDHQLIAWMVLCTFYDVHGYKIWSTEVFAARDLSSDDGSAAGESTDASSQTNSAQRQCE